MRTRATLAAALLAALLAVLPAGAGAAPKSKVTIKLSKDRASIEGRVKSKHAKCKRDRKIKLQSTERGFYRKTGTTNRRGRFSVGGPGVKFGQPMPPSSYYVSAFRKGKSCPFAKSKVLEVK